MFTQCSKCETIFKLSAEVLRAAGGQVRCGKCGEVFNALARLAEDSSAFTSGETEFELESRADSILQTPPAPPASPPASRSDDTGENLVPPGVEIARLQILDWSEDELPPVPTQAEPAQQIDDAAQEEFGEASLEFTLPPGELDRIFVESKLPPRPTSQNALEIELGEPAGAPEEDAADADTPAPRSGFEVSEEVRREMLMGLDPETALAPRSLFADRAFLLWFGAAIACGLLLIGQVVHHDREWLAAHTPLGSILGTLYGALGDPVPPPANLSAYQLRQWGVTGDPAADGTLRVRASILNTAAQLEPYPLLRVTLANRFGSTVGARDFEPAEYLGKPMAKLLAPGERVDATMDIMDPGNSAEGFEIDVCLRGADRRVSCANDLGSPKP